ncbi:MAG: glycosyltransferase family 2 protein [Pseudomonadota bacterium]
MSPDLTIIAPMKNEEGNVTALVEELEAACAPLGPFEVILVDDGSTDQTAATIQALQDGRPWLRLLQHKTSGGQSAAVHSGVQAARADLICTLDGDGQNPPDQVPVLVAKFLQADTGTLGLVAGERVGRKDTASKRWASKLANRLRNWMLQDGTRDTGCGLKCFRRDVFLALPYFNHMHRYLPALVTRDGWDIAHVDVTHRERGAGTSNYTNLGRALVGGTDLLGVAWLLRRKKTARATEVLR